MGHFTVKCQALSTLSSMSCMAQMKLSLGVMKLSWKFFGAVSKSFLQMATDVQSHRRRALVKRCIRQKRQPAVLSTGSISPVSQIRAQTGLLAQPQQVALVHPGGTSEQFPPPVVLMLQRSAEAWRAALVWNASWCESKQKE